ncbi:hypothetical protein I79_008369 [Cricetulus griseus]|uniref:Uncharacterized protein n=1 Tax=Cricetulus griseus TaxID=10029 RepID=G3HCZ8_CRIGR|nr:hypothetical protein I79_008369 [Cricetulus griseus]
MCRCPQSQKRVPDPLELEPQVVLSWGTKLRFSERAICDLNHRAIFSALRFRFESLMYPRLASTLLRSQG